MPISVHSQGELQAYFERHARRGWGKFLQGQLGEAIGAAGELFAEYEPDQTGSVRRAFRSATRSARVKVIVWNWLRPCNPLHNSLEQLARHIGLGHLGTDNLASLVRLQCLELARTHSELAWWITARLPGLDYYLRARRTTTEDDHDALRLRNVVSALQAPGISADELGSGCAQLAAQALLAAAQAIADAIECGGDIAFSANIMVPGTTAFETAPARSAEALWEGVEHQQRLTIVAESVSQNSHLGFWVPIGTQAHMTGLAGGSAAFARRRTSVVLCSDLPALDGFGAGVAGRWQEYMENEFPNDLFAAIPITLPTASVPCAVLNINVSATGEEQGRWLRLAHPAWQARALRASWQAVETVFRALMIRSGQLDAIEPSKPLELSGKMPALELISGESED